MRHTGRSVKLTMVLPLPHSSIVQQRNQALLADFPEQLNTLVIHGLCCHKRRQDCDEQQSSGQDIESVKQEVHQLTELHLRQDMSAASLYA